MANLSQENTNSSLDFHRLGEALYFSCLKRKQYRVQANLYNGINNLLFISKKTKANDDLWHCCQEKSEILYEAKVMQTR